MLSLAPLEPPVSLAAFSFSPAEVPPAAPLEELPEPVPPDASVPASVLAASLLDDPEEASLEPVADVVLFAEVDVEVVWAAACSADVSVGGMMLGVLLGT